MPSSQEGLARLIERDRLVGPRIAAAFRGVDRADFVPRSERRRAYIDRPVGLPGFQTTSQPSLIAAMIGAADVSAGDRVLEIGTGYGFQTALLAELGVQVVSIEVVPELAEAARANLARAGFDGVDVRTGDGRLGCADRAPYDAIIVSAAADEIPPAFEEQMAEGGRLVIPLMRGQSDDVIVFVKRDGILHEVSLLTPARFVPLIRRHPDP